MLSIMNLKLTSLKVSKKIKFEQSKIWFYTKTSWKFMSLNPGNTEIS